MVLSQEEMNSQDEEKQWDWLAEQLIKNIDGFEIVTTEDGFGCIKYYWKCRSHRGERTEAQTWHDTSKQCLKDFFEKIEGFWLNGQRNKD